MGQKLSLPCPSGGPSSSNDELRSPLFQEAFPGCVSSDGLFVPAACQAHSFSARLSSGKQGGPLDRIGQPENGSELYPYELLSGLVQQTRVHGQWGGLWLLRTSLPKPF